MKRIIIKAVHVDPASLMAFGFCFSVIAGPVLILGNILWYLCFVFCMTFGNLLLGWLLDLALAWCKGINVEAMDEGPVVK